MKYTALIIAAVGLSWLSSGVWTKDEKQSNDKEQCAHHVAHENITQNLHHSIAEPHIKGYIKIEKLTISSKNYEPILKKYDSKQQTCVQHYKQSDDIVGSQMSKTNFDTHKPSDSHLCKGCHSSFENRNFDSQKMHCPKTGHPRDPNDIIHRIHTQACSCVNPTCPNVVHHPLHYDSDPYKLALTVKSLEKELEQKKKIIQALTAKLNSQKLSCSTCSDYQNRLNQYNRVNTVNMNGLCNLFSSINEHMVNPHGGRAFQQLHRNTLAMNDGNHIFPFPCQGNSQYTSSKVPMKCVQNKEIEIVVVTDHPPKQVYLKDPGSVPPCNGVVVKLNQNFQGNPVVIGCNGNDNMPRASAKPCSCLSGSFIR